MALFIPGISKCPICNTVVGENDERVATSHFIGDKADPLWSAIIANPRSPGLLVVSSPGPR
jgi:hypothetical protein